MADSVLDLTERVPRLERRLARARAENEILEAMIEEKTRSLYLAQEEVGKKNRFLQSVLRSMSSAVIVADASGAITSVEGTTVRLVASEQPELTGRQVDEIIVFDDGRTAMGVVENVDEDVVEAALRVARGGPEVPVIVSASRMSDDDGAGGGVVFVATDIRLRKQFEVELRHAQKLESIGQLAAGVAHEINTPIQYVGDGVHFLGDALTDLLAIQEAHQELRAELGDVTQLSAALTQIEALEDDADIAFLREEIPNAVARTQDGIERVATIVRAMKQFSHPGSEQPALEDLNDLVSTALAVTANEYKYVADVRFDPGSIPLVPCIRGDLSQVVLNLIVNAAQAVADRVTGTDRRGAIVIGTRVDNGWVVISVADDGGGVPVELRDRIFDPFFTTKEPGRGTGQGLAIAHGVLERHGGRIDLIVEDGIGSTFEVWLPEVAS